MPRGRQSAEVNPSLGFRFDRADGVSKDDPQKLSMQPAEAKQYGPDSDKRKRLRFRVAQLSGQHLAPRFDLIHSDANETLGL